MLPPPQFPYLGNGSTHCAENWCVIRRPPAMHLTKDGDIFSSARLNVHIFKHMYLLPLVHRPKDALLVLASHFPTLWIKNDSCLSASRVRSFQVKRNRKMPKDLKLNVLQHVPLGFFVLHQTENLIFFKNECNNIHFY